MYKDMPGRALKRPPMWYVICAICWMTFCIGGWIAASYFGGVCCGWLPWLCMLILIGHIIEERRLRQSAQKSHSSQDHQYQHQPQFPVR